jgi:alpha-tubulin suppressor-like RCC1 family protein
LPKFKQIAAGYYNNMAITQEGKIMSWGFGNLGQKNETLQDLPRYVETHVEGRNFQAVYMNQNSALFFAPLRVSSVRPFCGPS